MCQLTIMLSEMLSEMWLEMWSEIWFEMLKVSDKSLISRFDISSVLNELFNKNKIVMIKIAIV